MADHFDPIWITHKLNLDINLDGTQSFQLDHHINNILVLSLALLESVTLLLKLKCIISIVYVGADFEFLAWCNNLFNLFRSVRVHSHLNILYGLLEGSLEDETSIQLKLCLILDTILTNLDLSSPWLE